MGQMAKVSLLGGAEFLLCVSAPRQIGEHLSTFIAGVSIVQPARLCYVAHTICKLGVGHKKYTIIYEISVIFTHVVHEPAVSNGHGPLLAIVGHPCFMH